ncbi:type VII toxin-antitoxin system MntA family adenylyltransferase antitoxin [Anaerobaca lacustris]|uniref:Nucleotidyltransferase domain-containing protein n=1 Tax=Anaerobaca lacustris TaxID=3044600 RepID=A0AAW6TZY0_9BACT|nr:nucleotidyltransferase domain-containing protein [Sedimentisphaerales bacterium M17dextr]
MVRALYTQDMQTFDRTTPDTVSGPQGPKPVDRQQLAAVLEPIASIDFATVFGSAAEGIVRADSDLDVAVWLANGSAGNGDLLVDIVGRIEEAFAVTCDLTVLNTAGIVLRHEALKGRILFVRPGREESFSDFYARTCADYEDLMAWRTRQLAYRGYGCPSTVS